MIGSYISNFYEIKFKTLGDLIHRETLVTIYKVQLIINENIFP